VVEPLFYGFESGVLGDLLADITVAFEVRPGLVDVDAPHLERRRRFPILGDLAHEMPPGHPQQVAAVNRCRARPGVLG